MIFSDLQLGSYYRLGYNSAPTNTDVVNRVNDYINSSVKEILSDHILKKLRRREISFTTVANSAFAALPQAATQIHLIVDRTNRRELVEVSIDWIRKRDPGRAFTSTTPVAYANRGFSAPVAAQPSANGQLTVVSTSAADTTQVCYVEVITTAGYTRTYNVTLTGTTPVNIGGTDTMEVNKFYLNTTAAGEVYLKDSALVEMGRIGIGLLHAHYTLLELYMVPSSALTLYADVTLALTTMTQAQDECILPDTYSEAIINGVMRREYTHREKLDQANTAEAARMRILRPLKLELATKQEMNDYERPQYSQLGPWFPDKS